MALHTDILLPRRSRSRRSRRSSDRAARVRLEGELAEATTILHRLEAEDRIGLVYPVMDEARRFLARARRRID